MTGRIAIIVAGGDADVRIELDPADAERLSRGLADALRREEVDRRVREIQARVARMPVLDPRDHGDMLYDENGLPR